MKLAAFALAASVTMGSAAPVPPAPGSNSRLAAVETRRFAGDVLTLLPEAQVPDERAALTALHAPVEDLDELPTALLEALLAMSADDLAIDVEASLVRVNRVDGSSVVNEHHLRGSVTTDGRFRLTDGRPATVEGRPTLIHEEVAFDRRALYRGTDDGGDFHVYPGDSDAFAAALLERRQELRPLLEWAAMPLGTSPVPGTSWDLTAADPITGKPRALVVETYGGVASSPPLDGRREYLLERGETWRPLSVREYDGQGSLVSEKRYSDYRRIAESSWRPFRLEVEQLSPSGEQQESWTLRVRTAERADRTASRFRLLESPTGSWIVH